MRTKKLLLRTGSDIVRLSIALPAAILVMAVVINLWGLIDDRRKKEPDCCRRQCEEGADVE